jgi:C-methyltransferase C-terminal domain/Methyltransferase domain/Putative zinc binding domain
MTPGHAKVVSRCQVCDSQDLQPVCFVGYLPPVNTMLPIGERPGQQPAFPAQVLYCPRCELVQIGLVVDPSVLFPPEYAYRSGTTRILRENFAEMYRECQAVFPLHKEDLVVDIGSNDGTLLGNFLEAGHRVHGVEPTDVGHLAQGRGVRTTIQFFGSSAVQTVLAESGKARLVTATNVFAHIDNIHDIVKNIIDLLGPDGVFISESHYLMSLLETLQYDTIYHEHLRYYSLHSLQYLLQSHGLEVIHARRIPTHGGSIRVYAARKGTHSVRPTVQAVLAQEKAAGPLPEQLKVFRDRMVRSKLELYSLLCDIKKSGGRVYGIGAPSRASTLINYVGLDEEILDCVLEVKGSLKVGKYIPGTLIPVLEETKLYTDQPEYVLFLSWHIADELAPVLKQKGYKGRFIVPLPTPRVAA